MTNVLPDITLEFAFNTGDPDPWVAIPADLFLEGEVTMGSSRFDGVTVRYDAGKMSVTLDNSDGRFDPTNLAGPYVAGGQTLLTPMRGIRLRALWDDPDVDPLFTGFIDGIPASYLGTDWSQVKITATDGSKVLANFDGAEQTPQGAGEDTGARIARIADNAQWPDELRDIDTGITTVQDTTLAQNAWEEMLLTVDTENGELYFDGRGYLRFRNRHAMYLESRSNTSQGAFSDRAPDMPYVAVVLNYDDDQLRNLIRVSRAGGTVQEAEDLDSQLRYSYDGAHPMPRTWGRNDLIMETDVEALSFAQFVLYQNKDADLRLESMEIEPQAAPDDLFPQVLGRKLGDRITGIIHTPNGGTIERDVFIRGIKHTLSTGYWRTAWSFQSATKFAVFVLDDPLLGVLDENVLAY